MALVCGYPNTTVCFGCGVPEGLTHYSNCPLMYWTTTTSGNTNGSYTVEYRTAPTFNHPSKEPTMPKLSQLSAWTKRLFSEDDKALYKAGYIDDCGRLTPKGKEALDVILFEQNKAKLVSVALDFQALDKAEKKEEKE